MRDVHILSVPYDSALLGWRMGAGPRALLASGVMGRLLARGHTVRVSEIHPQSDLQPVEIRTAFEIAGQIALDVRIASELGALPVILAGNCGTALGAVAGLSPRRVGVAWFDAHGDYNTPETSRSGFLDGMSLATLTGRCWQGMAQSVDGFAPVAPADVLLLGARDLDEAEGANLEGAGILRFPPNSLGGLPSALDDVRSRVEELYVHVDLDVLDPTEAQANGYAAPDGLTVAQLLDTLGQLRSRFRIAALGITAYDPTCDPDGRIPLVVDQILDVVLSESA